MLCEHNLTFLFQKCYDVDGPIDVTQHPADVLATFVTLGTDVLCRFLLRKFVISHIKIEEWGGVKHERIGALVALRLNKVKGKTYCSSRQTSLMSHYCC